MDVVDLHNQNTRLAAGVLDPGTVVSDRGLASRSFSEGWWTRPESNRHLLMLSQLRLPLPPLFESLSSTPRSLRLEEWAPQSLEGGSNKPGSK